jgi:hypothetical protein
MKNFFGKIRKKMNDDENKWTTKVILKIDKTR